MVRVKRGPSVKKRHQKVVQQASGYVGRASNVYKIALERVMKSMQYQYRDRKRRKREFNALWIKRINSSCRILGTNYSMFSRHLKNNNILLNNKILSQLAVYEPLSFESVLRSSIQNHI